MTVGKYKAYATSKDSALISVNAIDVDGEKVPVDDLVEAYAAALTEETLAEPYPNEHAIRLKSPGGFVRFRRANNKLGTGVHAVFGFKEGGGSEIQSIRFDASKFTAVQAKKWLKDHDYKTSGFEKATKTRESALAEAVTGSLEDYARSVKDAFRSAFRPASVPEGVPFDLDIWARDVFKDDPTLGDSVVVRAEDGLLYAVNYSEASEGGFEFDGRDDWHQVVLTYVPVSVAEVAESVELSESASGRVLDLTESDAAAKASGGPRAPLMMDVALIQPGWGNKRDNFYYTRELLKRDAKVFEGVKMYSTGHRADEKSVRTEVSTVKEVKGFTDSGAPIASVAVHDPDFAEATRNRKKLGTLDTLECSILASGIIGKKYESDGRRGKIVEAITSATAVDWVTKAGAGGHAIALAENSKGGDNMSEEVNPQETQEQEEVADTAEATLSEANGDETTDSNEVTEVTYLAEAEVEKMLKASQLPQQAQTRLAEGEYLDEEALKAAIEAERAYIKELTGGGRPFAQGESSSPDEEATMSEADYTKEYNDILSRHGLYVKEAA
jgi:hypothetical protein